MTKDAGTNTVAANKATGTANSSTQGSSSQSNNTVATSKVARDLVVELAQIQKNKDIDFQQKAELLNKFFHEGIIEELRREQKR